MNPSQAHVRAPSPLQINLKDHCLLCLVEPEDPSSLYANSLHLQNIQPLIYHLTATDPRAINTSQQQSNLTSSTLKSSSSYLPVFTNIPPLCPSCYLVLSEMQNLHQQLIEIQLKLEERVLTCRKIISGTCNQLRPGNRAINKKGLFFKRLGTGMSSLLPKQQLEAVRYFLDNFHGLIAQAENKFVFPSSQGSSPDAVLKSGCYPVQFVTPNSSVTTTSVSSEVIMLSGTGATIKYEFEDEGDDQYDPLEPDHNTEIRENPIVVVKEDLDFDDDPIPPPPESDSDEEMVAVASPEAEDPDPAQPCDVCNLYVPLSHLPDHLTEHLGKSGWSCETCRRVFLSRSRLIQHCLWKANCRKQQFTYNCTQCPRILASEGALHNHIWNQHEVPGKRSLKPKWTCGMCEFAARTEQGLDFHFNLHLHPTKWEEPGSATLQARLPPGKPPLTMVTSDVRKKGGIVATKCWKGGLDFSCDICGKTCCGSTALLRHVREVHKKGMGRQGQGQGPAQAPAGSEPVEKKRRRQD